MGAGSGAGHCRRGWCWWPWLTLRRCGGGGDQLSTLLLSVVVTGCGRGVLVVMVVVVEEFEVPCDFP